LTQTAGARAATAPVDEAPGPVEETSAQLRRARGPGRSRTALRRLSQFGWEHSTATFPGLAFLTVELVCAVAAATHGFNWFTVASRIRWDGGIYVDIARTGYYAAPCSQINPHLTRPGATCGNAAWFPLLPYLSRGLSAISGLTLEFSALAVAEGCCLLVFALVWQQTGGYPAANRLCCLLAVALLPSGVYFHATFPMSLSVALALAVLLLLERGRWVTACLAGCAAALAYPLGGLLAPAGAVLLLLGTDRRLPVRLTRSAVFVGAVGAGWLGFFGLLRQTTGQFDAYLKIQGNYTSGLHNPLATLVSWLRDSPRPVALEMLFSLSLLASAVYALVAGARAGRATALDRVLATVYGPLVVVVPLLYGLSQSQYRAHSLLAPLAVTLRHLRPSVVAAIAAVSAPLLFVLTYLFLQRVLV
jgi:hypothetical protein